ncbi:MAG: methyltransferase domain-containing protein, partial [Bacteroidota bacterium]
MDFLANFPQQNKVYYLSPHSAEFESAYLDIREKEGRVHSDEQVLQLPRVAKNHPHAQEWKVRIQSLNRFMDYLKKHAIKGRVLDLGCGNGWFTRYLMEISGVEILGADINRLELEQAARLFNRENGHFAYGDIFAESWPTQYFQLIVLNSCIQYFPNLKALMDRLMTLVHPHGEIHILDSPFYAPTAVPAAQVRSRAYYEQMEVLAMTDYYHHQSWEELQAYSPAILYRPNSWRTKISKLL